MGICWPLCMFLFWVGGRRKCVYVNTTSVSHLKTFCYCSEPIICSSHKMALSKYCICVFVSLHESILALSSVTVPLVGYITYYSLTHIHRNAISTQLEHFRASFCPWPKCRQPANPEGSDSQIGKTLRGPIVSTALLLLLSCLNASLSCH